MIITKRRSGFRLSRTVLLFASTLSIFLYILQGNTASLYISTKDFSAGTLLRFSNLPKANSTLGFGAIAAVSRTNSTRRDGLILAARITGLDITIPVQQAWTDEDIALVKAKEGSLLTRGSALAWLGHLNLLNWFLSTDLETVLILEDDVDWDIHLRTTQVPKVAATVRHLLNEQRGLPIRASPSPASAGGYWGDPKQWDILYLGHCGDEIKPGKWNFRVQRASFYDSTLPPRQVLEKKTRKMLGSIAMPENVRSVHQSIEPLCTFGFAITRAAAKKLLYDIALREPDGGVQAYDVRVLEACRDLGFRCWTSTPELFHHMHHGSEIAGVDKKAKIEPENRTSTSYEDGVLTADSGGGIAGTALHGLATQGQSEATGISSPMPTPDKDGFMEVTPGDIAQHGTASTGPTAAHPTSDNSGWVAVTPGDTAKHSASAAHPAPDDDGWVEVMPGDPAQHSTASQIPDEEGWVEITPGDTPQHTTAAGSTTSAPQTDNSGSTGVPSTLATQSGTPTDPALTVSPTPDADGWTKFVPPDAASPSPDSDGWTELIPQLIRAHNETLPSSGGGGAVTVEEDDDFDYRDGHWQDASGDDDDDDDDVDLKNLPPQDPRRTPDKAPNIACGARWFRAKDEEELRMLREVVGRQGRCVAQDEEGG